MLWISLSQTQSQRQHVELPPWQQQGRRDVSARDGSDLDINLNLNKDQINKFTREPAHQYHNQQMTLGTEDVGQLMELRQRFSDFWAEVKHIQLEQAHHIHH